MSAIRFEGVRVTFPGSNGVPVVALDGLDLEVHDGEALCLIGRSGSGKTTALKTVNRLIEPEAGRVLVCGEDVRAQDPTRLRRRLGYVIQSGGLFPHFSVARNVGLLCELEGWSRARRKARVEELLHLVDLPPEEFWDRRPSELSGGQRQRVGVARALALDPEIVLLDEPFGALDPITRAQLQAEFRQLEAKVRKTLLLVTHDMEEAFAVGDRVALLDQGRLVQAGTEAEFRDRPENDFVRGFFHAFFAARTGA